MVLELLDAGCLSCGTSTKVSPCVTCGALVGIAPPEESKYPGTVVHAPQGFDYVVLGAEPSSYELVRIRSGELSVSDRVSHVRTEHCSGLRTVVGRLLALELGAAAAETRSVIRAATATRPQAEVRERRSLLLDLIRLGSEDRFQAEIEHLTESERAFWTGFKSWVEAPSSERARELIGLLERGYRFLLPLIASIATDDESTAPAVDIDLTAELASPDELISSSALVLAKYLNIHAHAVAGTIAARTRALPDDWGAQPTPLRAKLERIEQALASVSSTPLLTDDANDLPTSLVDDLIDAGDASVVLDAVSSRHHARALARTSPTKLSVAQCVKVGHDHELARRVFAGETALPNTVTGDRRRNIQRLLDDWAATGTREQLLNLGVTADAVEALLAAPDAIPDESTLQIDGTMPILTALATIDIASDPPGERQREFVGRVSLRVAQDRLFEWNLEGCREAAQHALRVSRHEALRDEALNMVAASHWIAGADDKALDALEEAIRGEYNIGLLNNAGIVAATARPDVATRHLTTLIAEAPDARLAWVTARRVIEIHESNRPQWEDDDDILPAPLRDALRTLIVRKDLEEEPFRQLAQLLSRTDADWLASPRALHGSPWSRSAAAELWRARASDFDKWIKTLARLLKRSPAPWLEEVRDSLAREAMGALHDEADDPASAVIFVMMLLEHKIPLPPDQECFLKTFVLGPFLRLNDDESEPADVFLDWLLEARRLIPQIEEPEARAELEQVNAAARDIYGQLVVKNRYEQFIAVSEHVEQAEAMLAQVPRHARQSAARELLGEVRTFAESSVVAVNRVIASAEDDDLRSGARELLGGYREILKFTNQFWGQ